MRWAMHWLRKLSQEERELVWKLYYEDGMSMILIAYRLGVSENINKGVINKERRS